jgi:hypothetical protein
LSSPGRRAGREVTERRDPVIHVDYRRALNFIMDCRVKPGNDNGKMAGLLRPFFICDR